MVSFFVLIGRRSCWKGSFGRKRYIYRPCTKIIKNRAALPKKSANFGNLFNTGTCVWEDARWKLTLCAGGGSGRVRLVRKLPRSPAAPPVYVKQQPGLQSVRTERIPFFSPHLKTNISRKEQPSRSRGLYFSRKTRLTPPLIGNDGCFPKWSTIVTPLRALFYLLSPCRIQFTLLISFLN
jgi:hypothetical protein